MEDLGRRRCVHIVVVSSSWNIGSVLETRTAQRSWIVRAYVIKVSQNETRICLQAIPRTVYNRARVWFNEVDLAPENLFTCAVPPPNT